MQLSWLVIADRRAEDAPSRRMTTVLIVAIGWGWVVLLMVLAEALGPGGSVLGAFFTLVMYGVLPLGLVLYIGGARSRARRRRLEEAAVASGDVDPGGGGEPAGDAVAPIRKEA
jgi:4-amino-4-deoxy-L-arabinose transferase-like glycosyltransferase